MEKPDVDSIDGLSPAISIDQKTTSRNPRSTVGTVTEIYDYLRLLYARVGKPHCPSCGRPIAGQSVQQIVRSGAPAPRGDEVHGERAGRPRPQGRVPRRLRAPARRGVHARARSTASSARSRRRSSSTRSSSTRSRSWSTGSCSRRTSAHRLTDSVETALALADRLVVIDVVGRRGDDVLRALRVSVPRRRRCRSSSRASSRSTRRTAPARAARGSATSRRSTPTCSSRTRRSRSPTARSSRGRSAGRPTSTTR